MPNVQNSSVKWLEMVRNTINKMDGMKVPEANREVITRCLWSEFYRIVERRDEIEENRNTGKKWSDENIETLTSILSGRIADSWTAEKMNLSEASIVLKRPEKSVKKKAIELGFAKAVDYWMNRNDPE